MWGANGYYQVGDNTTTQRNSPKNISGSVEWSKIGIGSLANYSIALRRDGTLWGWGENFETSSIGNGYTGSTVSIPSQIGSSSIWKDVSVGGYHNIISDTDGQLYSWGKNNSGQLGVGDSGSRTIITNIANLSQSVWKQFAAGTYHSLAVRENGELWGWGENASAQLGDGTYTDNAVRIFNFNAATTDTPSYNGATNFYTSNPYSESSDPGVAGTKEATVRLGVLKYDVTNYSSGYLPVGPNRSGDTGTQYFTFAFRRKVVANFDINITSSSGISGLWIAAPGTNIDSTSGLNGWLRADTAYAGSGIPGSGTGGNGSDGCAYNNGDRILSSTSLSGGYTMTLGSENLSNATGNVLLVRIALTSGQSITSLSIGAAVL